MARRLLAEPVALVFAAREPGEEFRGLPELRGPGAARRRCAGTAQLGGRAVRWMSGCADRIVAETRGNPLALLELPRGSPRPSWLAGSDARVVRCRADRGELPAARCEALPAATRRLLLVAAAEPTGDRRWCGGRPNGSGSAAEAVDTAADAGLLVIGERVVFRHPLVRSAVYRAASPPERRVAHQALAEATDPERRPGSPGLAPRPGHPRPDEDVAASWSARQPGPGARRTRGGGRLPGAAVALTLRSGAAGGAGAGRRAGRSCQAGAFDAACGCWLPRRRAAGRAPAAQRGPAARPDRVRVQPRQ